MSTPAKTTWYRPWFSKTLKNMLNLKIHLMSMNLKILDCSVVLSEGKYRHIPEVQHVTRQIWGIIEAFPPVTCLLSKSLCNILLRRATFFFSLLEATDSLHPSNEVYDIWGGGVFFPLVEAISISSDHGYTVFVFLPRCTFFWCQFVF